MDPKTISTYHQRYHRFVVELIRADATDDPQKIEVNVAGLNSYTVAQQLRAWLNYLRSRQDFGATGSGRIRDLSVQHQDDTTFLVYTAGARKRPLPAVDIPADESSTHGELTVSFEHLTLAQVLAIYSLVFILPYRRYKIILHSTELYMTVKAQAKTEPFCYANYDDAGRTIILCR